jgi:hypothetical protein
MQASLRVDRSEVVERLKERGVTLRCGVCNTGSLAVRDTAVLAPLIDRPNSIDTGRGVALVPAVCSNCGHTMLFDLQTLGIELKQLTPA